MQVKVMIELGDGYSAEVKIEQLESLPKLLTPAYGEPGYNDPQPKADWPAATTLVGEVVADALDRFAQKLAVHVNQDHQRVARAKQAKQEELDAKARASELAA